MNFDRILIEEQILEWPNTKRLLEKLSQPSFEVIRKVEDYFGRFKKPYLQKRAGVTLFVGRKEGQLVKETPPAYGFSSSPHYYFIHSYNCIFECQYCYLQGYFSSPDIVLFLNHGEMCEEMERITKDVHPNESEVWFHAGEYSDSLALSALTGELSTYWESFSRNPRAQLELRTKSVNIRELMQMPVLPNIVPTFSIASETAVKNYDLRTPPLQARLKAIGKLADKGYNIGIHMDPIVFREDFKQEYQTLCESLFAVLPNERLKYLSIGVVRFTKDVYRQVELNYPRSDIVSEEYVRSFDGKVRYSRPLRNKILQTVESQLVDVGYDAKKIYRCMEDEVMCSSSLPYIEERPTI